MTRRLGSARWPSEIRAAVLACAGTVLVATLIALPGQAAQRGLHPLRAARRAGRGSGTPDAAVGRPGPTCSPQSDVLSYHGGDLIAHADIFVLFWGAEWQTDVQHKTAAADVLTLYQELGTTAYACSWGEYALPQQPIGASTFHGSEVITSEPPSPLQDQVIQERIVAEVAAGRAPAPTDDTVYIVLPPRGVPVDLFGDTGCGGSNFLFCGYHASFRATLNGLTRFRYAVLPFPCDAQRGSCFFDGVGDAGRSLQVVGSHELAEMVTDPDVSPATGDGGWYSDTTGNENADICALSGCNANIAAGQDTLLVNSLWSNLAKGCIDSVPCPSPPVECTDPAPGACVPGKGTAGGCAFEWLVYPNLRLTAAGLPDAQVICADGQPFCDFDSAQDGQCTFQVAACLNSSDPRLQCTAPTIQSVKLSHPLPTSRNATDSANAQTILAALSTVDTNVTGTVKGAKVTYSPAAAGANSCGEFFKVVVPLRIVHGQAHKGTRTISPMVQTGAGRASNRLTLVCNPSFP